MGRAIVFRLLLPSDLPKTPKVENIKGQILLKIGERKKMPNKIIKITKTVIILATLY